MFQIQSKTGPQHDVRIKILRDWVADFNFDIKNEYDNGILYPRTFVIKET